MRFLNELLRFLVLWAPLGMGPGLGITQPVFGPGPESAASILDAIVAVVDNEVVTRRELDAATMQSEQQLLRKKAPLPPRPVLERRVLERLILTHLQLRVAERNGITIDDTTLNAAIDHLARRNNMSLTQLRQTVEKEGIGFAKFRDEVRRELTMTRLRQKVVDEQIQISEQDVDNAQAQLAGSIREGREDQAGINPMNRRHYHIAQILIAVPEGASPEQITAAKRQAEHVLERLRHGEDFRQLAIRFSADQQALEGGDLGWRDEEQLPTLFAEIVPQLKPGELSGLIRSPSGFHIVKVLEVRDGDHAATGSDRPLASTGLVSQIRARHILLKTSPTLSDEEARLKLEELRRQILAGADFAELARRHSADRVSGARGGELGWVSSGMLVPEFEQELRQLADHQISAPFKTPFGWHLAQVLERRQVQASPETERARIREALFRRRADEEWEQWLRQLRDEAYVEIRLPPLAEVSSVGAEF